MPLNCPQREENLRLPSSGGGQPPSRGHKRKPWVILLVLVLLALLAVVGYWWQQTPSRSQNTPTVPAVNDDQHSATDESTAASAQTQLTEAIEAAPTPFCERDFAATDKRRQDIDTLQAAGGLVLLLRRKQAAPPFACAAFYLSQGLDVNAVNPDGVSALHYAIDANAPQMVQFVIDHGADLHQKAGDKQLEPMGYAYYLALNDRSTNRNPVIEILNAALEKSENTETQPADTR